MNKDFLFDLLSVGAVSGNEYSATKLFSDYLRPYCEEVSQDRIGNAYAILNKGKEPCVMLEAHIDVIGFQVSYIDELGYIYLRACGGVDIASVIASRVKVHTRTGKCITGVIGKNPIHTQKPDERKTLPDIDGLWVDVGLCVNDIKKQVRVGDYVSLDNEPCFIGDNKITASGLDDNIGIYIIAESLKRLSLQGCKHCIVAMAAVQEEIGCKGAKVGVANTNCSIAICVDVCFATDVPNMSKKKYGEVALGSGPVIILNADSDHELSDMAIQIARDEGIPYQLSAYHLATGGNDASRIQRSGKGVKTLTIGIPNRYMHTSVEMCDLRDVNSTVSLIVNMINNINN